MLAKSVNGGGNGGSAADDYILIRDEKTAGTNGGSFTAGAWRTRDLNTLVVDSGGFASLAANQITLGAGTYKIKARCPAAYARRHKCKLRNISDATDIVIGTSNFAFSGDNVANESFIEGRFTIASSKILEIQHRCENTQASLGFGVSVSFGVIEVYSAVELWREA